MTAAEQLEVTYVPVDCIDPNPWNPNVQSDVVARATRESLERYGFVDTVLLRPHPSKPGRFEIINGEHRWKESQALGIETLPAVVRPLSDDDAKKLTVVLNETHGDPDQLLLAQLLEELSTSMEDDFRVALPYSDKEIDKLLALANPDETPPRDPDPPPADPTEHELVLTFSPGRYDEVRGWLTMLTREYGISDVTGTVYEALRREALRANQS